MQPHETLDVTPVLALNTACPVTSRHLGGETIYTATDQLFICLFFFLKIKLFLVKWQKKYSYTYDMTQ